MKKVRELEEKLTRIKLIIYTIQLGRFRGVYRRDMNEYRTQLEKWINEKNLIELELKLIRSKKHGSL